MRVGDSLQRSEEIVKNLELRLSMQLLVSLLLAGSQEKVLNDAAMLILQG